MCTGVQIYVDIDMATLKKTSLKHSWAEPEGEKCILKAVNE